MALSINQAKSQSNGNWKNYKDWIKRGYRKAEIDRSLIEEPVEEVIIDSENGNISNTATDPDKEDDGNATDVTLSANNSDKEFDGNVTNVTLSTNNSDEIIFSKKK
ncbi:unnamed protein product [Gordionus sp. m RMFG-2023]